MAISSDTRQRREVRSGAENGKGFRLDIQGIRGIALILVLLCHSEISWAEGGFVGLDIFYLLSGFLITGLILGEFRRKGSFSIRNFYARRAKRLLPLASTVLLFIIIGSLILFSTVRQIETAGDVLAAALYFVNWHFIAQGVDYFAVQEGLVSPVQHYWSLSVEEQFYVVWPALMLLCATLATRLSRNLRVIALTAMVPITIASLYYSIQYTGQNPEAAYFSTLTRIWELSIGGVLALVLPRATHLRTTSANLLVGSGLAAVLISGYVYSEIDPYPGWRALVPVLGTCAVIIGGSSISRGIVVRFLSLAPFQYLGKISYAWYLWHWPFIVFAFAIFGELSPGWLVVVTLAAWIPTEITHRLIEEPFRRSRYLNVRPRKALAIGATFSLAVIASTFAVKTDRIDLSEAPESRVAGAQAIQGMVKVQEKVAEIRPFPSRAREDKGEAFADGCLIIGPTDESGDCRYGEGAPDRKRIVLFGDSHALQYSPALIEMARKNNWNLTVLTRGNCLPADIDFQPYCDRWRSNALERIEEEEKPDLTIVATSTLNVYRLNHDGEQLNRTQSQPLLVDAMADTLNRLQEASGRVVFIRDQPRAPFLPFECVADHPKDLERCTFEPKQRTGWLYGSKAAKQANVPIVDPKPKLCNEKKCPSVIGNALVYRDTYHISATYSKTLAPWLEDQLLKSR